jgi:adenosylhomocysteine nucleosidase
MKAFCLLLVTFISIGTVHAQVTGILGAFGDETTLLLTQVQQKKDIVIQQIHFTQGLLRGRPVVVALSGVGKVNAAITTTLMLEHFHPSEIIFTGIAGAVDPALSPGDLVIGTEVGYHDYGALLPDSLEHWRTRNPVTNEQNPLYFPCDARLVQLALTVAKTTKLERTGGEKDSVMPRIVQGRIVTGDQFISSQVATAALYRQLQASATEMEGAAVAQTCRQQQVPFVVIRSMSDKAGNNAHMDMESFYHVAARNSAHLVMNMVERLVHSNSSSASPSGHSLSRP